jgi:hypothetical protein
MDCFVPVPGFVNFRFGLFLSGWVAPSIQDIQIFHNLDYSRCSRNLKVLILSSENENPSAKQKEELNPRVGRSRTKCG